MSKLNRENYSKKTLTVFEIVGAYFVDVIYHHLYETSKKTHRLGNSESRSLTDDYKIALSAYIDGVCNNKDYFGRTVKGILDSYRLNTRFSSISMNVFISELLEQFVPEEHLSVLGETEKHFFIHKIITRLVRIFIEKVSTPSLMKMVIDDRSNENNNIYRWIDEAIDCQIIIREEIVNQFVRQVTGQSDIEQVDIDVVRKITQDRDKLWAGVQELMKIKHSLNDKLNKSKQVAVQLVAKLTTATELIRSKNEHIETITEKYKEAIEELDTTVTKLREEAVTANISISKLKNKNADLKSQITQANIYDDYDIMSSINEKEPIVKSPDEILGIKEDESTVGIKEDETPVDGVIETPVDGVIETPIDSVIETPIDSNDELPVDGNDKPSIENTDESPMDDDADDAMFDLDDFLKNDPLDKIRSGFHDSTPSLM